MEGISPCQTILIPEVRESTGRPLRGGLPCHRSFSPDPSRLSMHGRAAFPTPERHARAFLPPPGPAIDLTARGAPFRSALRRRAPGRASAGGHDVHAGGPRRRGRATRARSPAATPCRAPRPARWPRTNGRFPWCASRWCAWTWHEAPPVRARAAPRHLTRRGERQVQDQPRPSRPSRPATPSFVEFAWASDCPRSAHQGGGVHLPCDRTSRHPARSTYRGSKRRAAHPLSRIDATITSTRVIEVSTCPLDRAHAGELHRRHTIARDRMVEGHFPRTRVATSADSHQMPRMTREIPARFHACRARHDIRAPNVAPPLLTQLTQSPVGGARRVRRTHRPGSITND